MTVTPGRGGLPERGMTVTPSRGGLSERGMAVTTDNNKDLPHRVMAGTNDKSEGLPGRGIAFTTGNSLGLPRNDVAVPTDKSGIMPYKHSSSGPAEGLRRLVTPCRPATPQPLGGTGVGCKVGLRRASTVPPLAAGRPTLQRRKMFVGLTHGMAAP